MEMNQMPVEMIEEILVSLPVKTLLRFKCVRKAWCGLIESRRFVERHYFHDSNRDRLVFRILSYNIKDKQIEEQYEEANKLDEQFEEANVDGLNMSMGPGCFIDTYRMGPVNGVICELSPRATIELLNPATREVKRLPSLPPLSPRWAYLRFGFGIDPSTGDYKTVSFYGAEFACVYSVSSGCWRVIEGVDPSLLSTSLRCLLVEAKWGRLCGGFCNGVYYWICGGILAFDTITETFREVELPAGVGVYHGGVGVYGGSTALFLHRTISLSDVWVLGKNGCWSKIFSFPMAAISASIPFLAGSRLIPVCVWKNEMVLQSNSYDDSDAPYLITVDIRTHKVTLLRLPPRGRGCLLAAFSYKESLASFKSKHVNLANPSDVRLERKRKRPTDVNLANSSAT